MTEAQNRALSASVTWQESQVQDRRPVVAHLAVSTVLPAPAGAATTVTGCSSTRRSRAATGW